MLSYFLQYIGCIHLQETFSDHRYQSTKFQLDTKYLVETQDLKLVLPIFQGAISKSER